MTFPPFRTWARRLSAGPLLILLGGLAAPSPGTAQEPASAPPATEQTLLGTWLSIQPTQGPLQTVLNFLPAGHLQVALAARFALHYEVLDSDESHVRISMSDEASGEPQEIPFELRDGHLVLALGDASPEQILERLPGGETGASPIVGRWRWQPPDRPSGIMEFASDGVARFDSVVQTFEATYRLEGDSVHLQEIGGAGEATVLRLSGDGLLGVDTEGKPAIAYRRAELPPVETTETSSSANPPPG
jgi:hypothetical protein